MKQKLLRLISWSALLSGASVLLAGEMAKAALPSPPVLATSASGLDQSLFCPIINIMFGVLIFVAVIMVMWAAYTYLTAGDDTEKVHRATKTLTYAAVAIVVAILAKDFRRWWGVFRTEWWRMGFVHRFEQ